VQKQMWHEGYVVVPSVAARDRTVYGIRTRYARAGEGEPLVLVHGGGPGASGVSGWSKTIPALCDRFAVYAVDLIGFGHTDKPNVEYSFQTLVNHLAGFIDVLGLDRVRLVGNSQGAYVAMKYTLDFPSRVEKAAAISTGTLANAVGIGHEGKGATLPPFDGSRESIRKFLEVIVNDPSKLTDELVDARYEAASLPGHAEMLRSLGRYRQLLLEDPGQRQVFDVTARLPLLNVPWCLLWGGEDRSAPLDPQGEGMRAMFPNVPFHVVEGSGHQVQNDMLDECNRLLRNWFLESSAF
jgi:pimeloyl-ACP methyl ester carboxylesterase